MSLPVILASIRLGLCLWPQSGYLHPDEMFQSVDIIGGSYFGSKIDPAWEFKTDRPIRCMLITYIMNSFAFRLVSLLQSKPSAYLLLVAPRLVYTLFSFLIDLCLYKMCQYHSSRGLWYRPISIIFQSSFICLGCLTRTLSNNIEVLLYSILLVLVCQFIKPRFHVQLRTPGRSSPAIEQIKASKQLLSSISIGALISIGTFNRPTFLIYTVTPILYWVWESFRRNSMNVSLSFRRAILPLSVSFAVTSLAISAFDTAFYQGYETLQELKRCLTQARLEDSIELIRDKWTLTPYNFFEYNRKTKNLANHGLNPPYMHALVNLPVYFNVLCLLYYARLVSVLVESRFQRLVLIKSDAHRISDMMLLSPLLSVILFSLVPHQEFRFLSPLVVPLVYSFGVKIYRNSKLLSLWLLINALLTLFYSNVHQAGVIKSVMDLDRVVKTHASMGRSTMDKPEINIAAFRSYLVPTYLLNIAKDDENFHLYLKNAPDPFESSSQYVFEDIVDRYLANDEDRSVLVFVMLPTMFEARLKEKLIDYEEKVAFKISTVNRYVPHFTGEDIMLSYQQIKEQGLAAFDKAFGFSLIRLDLSKLEDLE